MSLTIGKAIKVIREAKSKSLGTLSTEAKISVPYLSLIEGDRRNPSLEVIDRISRALDVPVDVFMLIGSSEKSSLTSSNELVSRLMSILNQMESFEQRIRDAV